MTDGFDHAAIFLLIAGTYTPFSLGVLRGPWGWSMLAAVWTLAFIGITLKIRKRTRHSPICIVLYVIMGWLAIVAVKPILLLVPMPGILLIVAGGIAYTGGLAFFAAHRIRYNHFIWHLFVIAGTTCRTSMSKLPTMTMPPGFALRTIWANALRASNVWCRTPCEITTSKELSLMARLKMFIWANDERGRPFVDLLVNRARPSQSARSCPT